MGDNKRVEERRETLIRVTDAHYIVRVERLENGKWRGVEHKVGDTVAKCRRYVITAGPDSGFNVISLTVPDRTVHQELRSRHLGIDSKRSVELVAMVRTKP